VDHLIERKGPGSITDFNVLNGALLRNIPRDWSRKNINVRPHLLLRFSMCTHQPIFPRFPMPTYAGVKQSARGTMMASARQEEKIVTVIIL